MAEIDLGQLAADRGTADELKKFAQMMITITANLPDRARALGSRQGARELAQEALDDAVATGRSRRDERPVSFPCKTLPFSNTDAAGGSRYASR
jgi:predicted outer membrane protein